MELRLDATPEELRVFLAETTELLQGLDEQLVRLEQDGASPELLQEIFRAAHTIKGSSAAIGHTRMAELTHAWETLLDRLRRGELAVGTPLTDRFFQALDVLKTLAGEVEALEQTDLDVSELVRALELWTSEAPSAESRPEPVIRPTTLASPPGATHHILLEFEAGPWASVRALQALMAVEDAAEILVSRPSRSEIESGVELRRLEAWLSTTRQPDAIRLALSEVAETRVLALMDSEEVEVASRLAQAERAAEAVGDGRGPERRSGARAGSTTIRIDVERLDHLLNLVGELVIDRTRLIELGRNLRDELGDLPMLTELGETTLHLGRVTDELQAEVMKSRMLPVGTVFSRFPRVVRDLTNRQGKRVELVIEGQETELDRSVIEEIGDPLVHLLRNAIDHGIEPPNDRELAGKPEIATVRLTAEHSENSIVIAVQDDGRGIDGERIRTKAVEKGIISADVAGRLSEHESIDLIFAPGFSTAAQLSDISGRGVGMDIVRTNVERLGGTVEVETKLGHGSRFVLRLPLTLAIVQALLVKVKDGVYALPLASVTETLRVPSADVSRLQRQEAILLRGQVLPIIRLSHVFGWTESDHAPAEHVLVVAVKVGERQLGLVVDSLLGEQEVVIKALGSLVGDVPGISSAAILGDGTVALIVDVPGLVQRVATEKLEWRWTDDAAIDVSRLAVGV